MVDQDHTLAAACTVFMLSCSVHIRSHQASTWKNYGCSFYLSCICSSVRLCTGVSRRSSVEGAYMHAYHESLASSLVRSALSLVDPQALSSEFLARPRYESALSWPLQQPKNMGEHADQTVLSLLKNSNSGCGGLPCWMHQNGQELRKPTLHTQPHVYQMGRSSPSMKKDRSMTSLFMML